MTKLTDAGLPPLPRAGRHLLERRAELPIRPIEALREAVKRTRAERPFPIDAWVVLPDHMHRVITLPPSDVDFSHRIKALKIRFAPAPPPTERRSSVRMAQGESQGQGLALPGALRMQRGIRQRRFWEHAIRDDGDDARHRDYVHFNPVDHGYVSVVAQ